MINLGNANDPIIVPPDGSQNSLEVKFIPPPKPIIEISPEDTSDKLIVGPVDGLNMGLAQDNDTEKVPLQQVWCLGLKVRINSR